MTLPRAHRTRRAPSEGSLQSARPAGAARERSGLSTEAGKHWIGGEWRRAGDSFDVRAWTDPFDVLGAWPRADGGVLGEALEACTAAAEPWAELEACERAARLLRALGAVHEDRRWVNQLRKLLGIGTRDLGEELARLSGLRSAFEARPDAGAPVSPGAGGNGSTPGPVAVLESVWSDLPAGTGRRLLPSLLEGRTVLVLSDERLPCVADAWGRALEAAELPAGTVSIVHGVGPELRAALLPDRGAPAASNGHGAPAEGRNGSPAVELGAVPHLPPPASRTVLVRREDDLAERAREIVQAAFGRGTTLSGQLHGHVGQVLCHERVFSRFTEALLASLQDDHDVTRRPVPLADAAAYARLRGVWELGLDEGAALIYGGEPLPGASRRRSERRVLPTVFTNVDAQMQVARRTEPAPVLCLIRVPGDEAGADLLRRMG